MQLYHLMSRLKNIYIWIMNTPFSGSRKKRIFAICLISFLGLNSMAHTVSDKDSVVVARLQYLHHLKDKIGNVWQGFHGEQADLPLIYYGNEHCYVMNPQKKFLTSFEVSPIYKDMEIVIYKTQKIDDTPFHMHMTYEFEEEQQFDYHTPYMRCSSLEITSQTIPDVTTLDVWATMVLHEYFHAFQFSHPAYVDYYKKHCAFFDSKTLQSFYLDHKWYKTSVNKENELLLKALAATDLNHARKYLRMFLKIRSNRRHLAYRKLHTDITKAEQAYEMTEGSARYIEAKLYERIPVYQSDDSWLYTAGKNYYYATGYNILRVLDKFGRHYQKELFTHIPLAEEELYNIVSGPSF